MVQLKKKREEIYSYVLLGLFFFSIINFLFLQPTIIGCNRYFNIFAVMIPIIIGIIILIILFKDFLISFFSSDEFIIPKIFKTFNLLFLAVVISYITIGQFANITWNVLSRLRANNKPKKVFICQVKELNKDIGIRVHMDEVVFLFQGRCENIETSLGTLNKYDSSNPEKYNIEVVCQKGINCLIVRNWKIVEKNQENQSSN